MREHLDKIFLEKKAENIKKIIPSFEPEIDDWYIREDNDKLLDFYNQKKVCFMKYRRCSKKFGWGDNFMIDFWFKNDITKAKGYDVQSRIDLWNKYNLYQRTNLPYDNLPYKAYYNFYINGIIGYNGLEADFYFRENIKYDEVLSTIKEIKREYSEYYFVNLDQILQNIMNEKYEIILQKIKQLK